MTEQFFSYVRKENKLNSTSKAEVILSHLDEKFKGNILEYLKIDKKKFKSSVISLIDGVQDIPSEVQDRVHVMMQEYFSDVFSTLPDDYSTILSSEYATNDQNSQIFFDVSIEAAIFLKLRTFASLYSREKIVYLNGKDFLFELKTTPIAINYPKTYALLEQNFLSCQKLLAAPVDPVINAELNLEEDIFDNEMKKFDQGLYGLDLLLSVQERQQRLLEAYGLLVHSQEQSIIEVIEDIDSKVEDYFLGIKMAIMQSFVEYVRTDQSEAEFLQRLSIALERNNISSANECTVM